MKSKAAVTRAPHQPYDWAPIAIIALLTLIMHLLTAGQYGYFRDELYYMACGGHLAWGYVDHPPLIAVIAALARETLGDSLVALRLWPALAHAGIVLFTGMLARRMGGNVMAQTLAALAAAVTPVYLGAAATLNMNPFEQLLWTMVTLLVLIQLQGGSWKLWLAIGMITGVALLNKHSFVFFLAALFGALLLTSERRVLKTRGPWVAAVIAAFVFHPNLVWEVHENFPTLEFLRNAAAQKNYSGSPLQFLSAQVLLMNPVALPLWLAGLAWLLIAPAAGRARVLGWSFVLVLLVMIALKAKHYYLAPAFSALLAAGAVAVTRFAAARRWQWLAPAYAILIVLGSALIAPIALPILPPEVLIRYTHAIGLTEPRSERHRPAKLPQTFADMFGWEEMVAAVARVYYSLPPEERARCAIFASNYGEAGAIDFFGPKYGLPKVSCGHNSYWLWGPANPDADIVITVGEDPEDVAESFHEVTEAARFSHEYNMPYESDLPILIGRRPRMSWREIWPHTKDYI